ncbi:cytochrome c oxidase subunit 2A [Cohnella candidum]|nr:cytochrome c oxidase subunit 2A [Cohnella candidum]
MKKKDKPSLKGTFVSVMLLGAFILVAWIGVFALYMARN